MTSKNTYLYRPRYSLKSSYIHSNPCSFRRDSFIKSTPDYLPTICFSFPWLLDPSPSSNKQNFRDPVLTRTDLTIRISPIHTDREPLTSTLYSSTPTSPPSPVSYLPDPPVYGRYTPSVTSSKMSPECTRSLY